MTLSRRFIARFGLDNNGQSLTNIGVTGASLTRSGAHDLTLASTATTSVTFPAGTITAVDTSSTQSLTNKSFGNNVTVTGVVQATDFNSTSDIKLKKNFTKISGLSTVLKLNGYEYDFISDDRHAAGVIAQEIEQVLPHVVNNLNDHKTVSYAQIIPYLIEAIKEQQKQIEDLKAQLDK